MAVKEELQRTVMKNEPYSEFETVFELWPMPVISGVGLWLMEACWHINKTKKTPITFVFISTFFEVSDIHEKYPQWGKLGNKKGKLSASVNNLQPLVIN